MSKKTKRIALYMPGGGARGAYQIGVLKGISDILNVQKIPFSSISGVSAGSINAATLASCPEDFPQAISKLESTWANIETKQMFDVSNYQIGKSFLRNITSAFSSKRQFDYLLNTEPLKQFLKGHLDFEAINTKIKENHLETLEIICYCYEDYRAISFYQSSLPHFEDWDYPRHSSCATEITLDHILASAAIPLFFPTVKINGLHYGDGGMSLIAPLRGCIRSKAEKILIIGTANYSLEHHTPTHNRGNGIGFAYILGSMLSSLFNSNLFRDIDSIEKMNEIARLVSMWKKKRSPWRPIETLYIKPNISISKLAEQYYTSMPGMVRFLFGLTGVKSRGGELLSFLSFEPVFTQKLLSIGYEDAMAQEKRIIKFFTD